MTALDFSCFGKFADLPMRVSLSEFKRMRGSLPEYSASTPTGVVPGKRWLCCTPYNGDREPLKPMSGTWWLLEYGPVRVATEGRSKGKEVCDTLSVKLLIEPDVIDTLDPPHRSIACTKMPATPPHRSDACATGGDPCFATCCLPAPKDEAADV